MLLYPLDGYRMKTMKWQEYTSGVAHSPSYERNTSLSTKISHKLLFQSYQLNVLYSEEERLVLILLERTEKVKVFETWYWIFCVRRSRDNSSSPKTLGIHLPNAFGFDEEKFLHAKLYKHGLGGYLRAEEQAQTPTSCWRHLKDDGAIVWTMSRNSGIKAGSHTWL